MTVYQQLKAMGQASMADAANAIINHVRNTEDIGECWEMGLNSWREHVEYQAMLLELGLHGTVEALGRECKTITELDDQLEKILGDHE